MTSVLPPFWCVLVCLRFGELRFASVLVTALFCLRFDDLRFASVLVCSSLPPFCLRSGVFLFASVLPPFRCVPFRLRFGELRLPPFWCVLFYLHFGESTICVRSEKCNWFRLASVLHPFCLRLNSLHFASVLVRVLFCLRFGGNSVLLPFW